MGYSTNVYKKAADKLTQRRITAQREADERRKEIFRRLPRAEELEKGIASSGIKAARAVIGGLSSSTLVTLVFIPIVYMVFSGGLKELKQIKAMEKAQKQK